MGFSFARWFCQAQDADPLEPSSHIRPYKNHKCPLPPPSRLFPLKKKKVLFFFKCLADGQDKDASAWNRSCSACSYKRASRTSQGLFPLLLPCNRFPMEASAPVTTARARSGTRTHTRPADSPPETRGSFIKTAGARSARPSARSRTQPRFQEADIERGERSEGKEQNVARVPKGLGIERREHSAGGIERSESSRGGGNRT